MFSGELVEVLKDKAAVASPLYRRLLLDAADEIEKLKTELESCHESYCEEAQCRGCNPLLRD